MSNPMFCGSLVALVTPMDAQGNIDFVAYKALIEWHVASGTQGIVVGGTTGESASLTENELINLIEAALTPAQGKLQIIAGNGTACTQKSVELTRAMADLPIDGFLTVTPYYVKPTQTGLRRHFEAIADTAHKPVILYNVPGRTGVDLINETVFDLSEHPNIVGIKDATADLNRARELITRLEGQFSLLSGDDATAQQFMEIGGHGVISVTSNVVPEKMVRRCQADLAGNHELARKIDADLADLHELLFIEPNPIPVKWVLSALGRMNNHMRLPMTELQLGKELLQSAIAKAMD